jgi:hypothetical protein
MVRDLPSPPAAVHSAPILDQQYTEECRSVCIRVESDLIIASDLRSYADTANPGYPTDAPHGSGGSAAMRATTKSTCLAACDSFASGQCMFRKTGGRSMLILSECKAVRWRPSSANGNQNSCFFSDSRYTSAPLGGGGYRNASSSTGVDLLVRDSSCEAEAGRGTCLGDQRCLADCHCLDEHTY